MTKITCKGPLRNIPQQWRHRVPIFFGSVILLCLVTVLSLHIFNKSNNEEDEIPMIVNAQHLPHFINGHLGSVVLEDKTVEKTNLATTLFKAVRILCLISSSKNTIESQAIYINSTWATKCNKFVFLSQPKENVSLPYLHFDYPEIHETLWDRIKSAFQWVYKHEIDNYDFFLKADDDSFYIMENLRFMLLSYNPDKPYQFGHRIQYPDGEGYFSGAAGYIFSRGGLNQLIKESDNFEKCYNGPFEDLNMGNCSNHMGIEAVDTRDHLERQRMLTWTSKPNFSNTQISHAYFQKDDNKMFIKESFNCCSNHLISLYHVQGETLPMIQYLIYHTEVIGNLNNIFLNATYGMIEEENDEKLEALRQASKAYNSKNILKDN